MVKWVSSIIAAAVGMAFLAGGVAVAMSGDVFASCVFAGCCVGWLALSWQARPKGASY